MATTSKLKLNTNRTTRSSTTSESNAILIEDSPHSAHSASRSTRSRKTNQKSEEPHTPVRASRQLEDANFSPIFGPFSQEGDINIDVGWDWNSPHTKVKHKITKVQKPPKRPPKSISPDLAIKKTVVQNKIAFDKLEEQVREFKNKVTQNKLAVENVNDDDNQNASSSNSFDNFLQEDDIDKHLMLLSQKIEEQQEVVIQPVCAKASPRTLIKSFSSDFLINKTFETTINKSPTTNKKTTLNFNSKLEGLKSDICNDSFENALEEFKDEDFELLSQITDDKSDPKIEASTSDDVVKFKTKSFSFGDSFNMVQLKLPEDVEKRRQEALAKLKANKRQDSSESETSPIKCSPEEIAQKRQQAMEKLKAKKHKELIEKNRREAMQRLEVTMKKRGLFPIKKR